MVEMVLEKARRRGKMDVEGGGLKLRRTRRLLRSIDQKRPGGGMDVGEEMEY